MHRISILVLFFFASFANGSALLESWEWMTFGEKVEELHWLNEIIELNNAMSPSPNVTKIFTDGYPVAGGQYVLMEIKKKISELLDEGVWIDHTQATNAWFNSSSKYYWPVIANEAQLCTMAGVPSNWFDDTPNAGLQLSPKGWGYLPAILDQLVMVGGYVGAGTADSGEVLIPSATVTAQTYRWDGSHGPSDSQYYDRVQDDIYTWSAEISDGIDTCTESRPATNLTSVVGTKHSNIQLNWDPLISSGSLDTTNYVGGFPGPYFSIEGLMYVRNRFVHNTNDWNLSYWLDYDAWSSTSSCVMVTSRIDEWQRIEWSVNTEVNKPTVTIPSYRFADMELSVWVRGTDGTWTFSIGSTGGGPAIFYGASTWITGASNVWFTGSGSPLVGCSSFLGFSGGGEQWGPLSYILGTDAFYDCLVDNSLDGALVYYDFFGNPALCADGAVSTNIVTSLSDGDVDSEDWGDTRIAYDLYRNWTNKFFAAEPTPSVSTESVALDFYDSNPISVFPSATNSFSYSESGNVYFTDSIFESGDDVYHVDYDQDYWHSVDYFGGVKSGQWYVESIRNNATHGTGLLAAWVVTRPPRS